MPKAIEPSTQASLRITLWLESARSNRHATRRQTGPEFPAHHVSLAPFRLIHDTMEPRIVCEELHYGGGPRHTLDIYHRPTIGTEIGALGPLLVFVHGGAWRSGEKAEHKGLATRLLELAPVPCAVAVVEYSLSPRTPTDSPPLYHPAHAQDVLAALEYLRNPPPSVSSYYDPSRMYLIGHSAGAHILASIFLQPPPGIPGRLEVSKNLVQSVKGIVMAEGIYDIDLLLSTHPDYRGFIEGAFDVRSSYVDVSPTSYVGREEGSHITWLVVQSPGDNLIRQDQADAMLGALKRQTPSEKISCDYDSVTEDHDELLRTSAFQDCIWRFVNQTNVS